MLVTIIVSASSAIAPGVTGTFDYYKTLGVTFTITFGYTGSGKDIIYDVAGCTVTIKSLPSTLTYNATTQTITGKVFDPVTTFTAKIIHPTNGLSTTKEIRIYDIDAPV